MTDSTRTVGITGVSSGFGAGAVRAIANRGYRVRGTMRDTAGRNSGKSAALAAITPAVRIIEMDVADDGPVTDGFAAILAEGPVDILINNAGIMYIGMTEAFRVAQAHEQMDTNHFGAIRAMQAVLPGMRAEGAGVIINTSSVAGRVSVPFFGTCCATRHAPEARSQSLRPEVAPFGITWGVDEAHAFTQPRQDALLAAMQPDGVLGGMSA